MKTNENKKNKYHTIIVGGGIAGLTSAAYLARAGKNVLLVEKNKECGGLVNSFTIDGFTFDAGVRALEDAGIILPMLKDLGIDIEFLKSPVSVGIEDEMLNIKDLDSLQEYKELLLKFYPESEVEINDLLKNIKTIMKHMDVLYGIENPLFKNLSKDFTFVFKKLLPWFPKFIFTIGKINSMQMPVEEYLENILVNTSLKDIVSQHFFKNTPTFFALSYFSLYLDYLYPKGGVGKISEAVESKILGWGGVIKKETTITEIFADQKIVISESGARYFYDNLIWAADLKALYRNLRTDNLSERIIKDFETKKQELMKNRGGDSVYSLFLEVDEPLDSFRKISNGHLFYTPSSKGLGQTNRKELDTLLRDFESLKRSDILNWLDKFINLNTYEISITVLKDQQLAPKGQTGVIISFLAEYDLFKAVEQAGWLAEFIPEIEKKVLKIISHTVFPMLKTKVIKKFSFTPLSIENRIATSQGGITGWAFRKNMPVINKIQMSTRSVLTPIPSIYQAGQWAYSPAGVPMSILTGKIAADKAV